MIRSSRRLLCTLTGVLALTVIFPARAQQQQAPNQPGTKWTEGQMREVIDVARVGRKLTPKSWPNGARVAVCLSFDTDTQAP